MSDIKDIEQLLEILREHSTITPEAAVFEMKKKDIMKRHNKPITFCPSDGKHGRWQTKVLEDGRWKVKKWTHERDLYDYLEEMYKKIDGPAVKTPRTVVGEWLPLMKETKPATYCKHLWIWETYIAPDPIAEADISQIYADDLEAWIIRTAKDKNCTTKRVLEIKTLWNLLLDYAARRHYCTGNESRLIRGITSRAGVQTVDEDSAETEDPEVFTDAEASQVCRSALKLFRATGDPIYMLIPFAFCTGVRVGEGVAIKFGDFRENRLRLCRSEVKHYETDASGKVHKKGFDVVQQLKKGHKFRDIPLARTALDIVDLIRDGLDMQGLPTGPDAWLFVRPDNGRRHHVNDVGKILAGCCIDAGIVPRSFHKIRKTWASRLIRERVPVTTVARIAGHKSPKTTLDVYAKDLTDFDDLRQQMDRILTFSDPDDGCE